jgi:hypothetical protein
MTTRARGRPSSYRPEYAEQAYKLCLLGATDVELADFFGVNPTTIYVWQRAHVEFSKSIRAGKILADAEVASKLFERACGYSHGATKLYRNEDGSVTQVPYTIEYPPDTQAASLWLRNRRRQDWRDRHDVVVEDAGTDLLDTYSEDQLITRLMQRRAQCRSDGTKSP